jgi:3-methyl-2-oxobutanoate hydroxymethyltransferase
MGGVLPPCVGSAPSPCPSPPKGARGTHAGVDVAAVLPWRLVLALSGEGNRRDGLAVSTCKVTAGLLREMKGREPIAALTAYDFPMARLLDEAGIPLLLVGDSLGMVLLGYPDTTWVTMPDMEHHVRAVTRAKPRALVVADLPIRSYDSVPDAVANAQRLAAAGAEAVKAEGGRVIRLQVGAMVAAGIPVVGHLGMLPQHIHEEGRYRIKGRTAAEREGLLADGEALVAAGVFAVVLELVEPSVAAELTARLPVPTIGIGSGPECDGQVLVTQDLVGGYPWFTPRHVQPRAAIADAIREAAREWREALPRPRAPRPAPGDMRP